MPACHSHLVRLVDLHHRRTLDHRRSIIIATSSPRISPHFLISLLCHFLAFSPLRHTASSLCARSQPWLTQPPYPMRSPLHEYRWVSYASGLLVSLLSPTFGIISLLLLVSTPPHFSDFMPTLTRPVSFRVSYFLSSTPTCMLSLSRLRSPCAPACAITYT